MSAALLASCSGNTDGAADIVFIGSESELEAEGLRLSDGGQAVRGATDAGLVALDSNGEVVPALAESWIVTDDGLSFIFRLRNDSWPDGSSLTAQSVRASLMRVLDQLDGTSLGLDLAPIEDVRAMAGRVIEVRLKGPEPALLQLLAQPELALRREGESMGEMTLSREEGPLTLAMKPPEQRGLPEDENWQDTVRTLRLFAREGPAAVDAFYNGDVDLVLGGHVGYLPLIDLGPLSRGTALLDPALGLFGLQIRRARGPLADRGVREAIAMALDRNALTSGFNVGGWTPTTRIVAPGMADDPGLVDERWTGADLAELRARAGGRVLEWRAAQPDGGESAPVVTVWLGEGPGYDLLLRELSTQLGSIGIDLQAADSTSQADLVLVDRVARYAGPRWFLNQFACSLGRGLCSEDADLLVEQALEQRDTQTRDLLLAEAEEALTQTGAFIPFGSPLRWSLVRGDLDGFAANVWAYHPLPAFARITS